LGIIGYDTRLFTVWDRSLPLAIVESGCIARKAAQTYILAKDSRQLSDVYTEQGELTAPTTAEAACKSS